MLCVEFPQASAIHLDLRETVRALKAVAIVP